MLPTFIVIGAMKAGTTSLWDYLRHHPQIFMCPAKEPNFFVEERNWDLGTRWYESQFAWGLADGAVGEASPSYSQAHRFHGVPERIARVVPDVKLIYVLRHPIERLRSHYWQLVSQGAEMRPIEQALREEAHYLNTSRYAFQLERYLPYFPLDRILLVTSEDLKSDRIETLRRIYTFLGVDPDWSSPGHEVERHRTEGKTRRRPTVQRLRRLAVWRAVGLRAPAGVREAFRRLTSRRIEPATAPLPETLERELAERLRPDVEQLCRLMPPGFDGWGIA